MQPGQADGGIGLVDGAIGLDPQVMLGHPLAITQRGPALVAAAGIDHVEIGRASCRERVCQSGEVAVVAESLKINKERRQPTAMTTLHMIQFEGTGDKKDRYEED